VTTPYGDYAERAANAIAALIRGDSIPATPHARQVALGARDIIAATLRERIHEQFGIRARNDDPRASMHAASPRLRTEPVTELAYVIERLPRLRPEDRRSPLDVLTPIDDPVAAAWVAAARNLLVADHILATAEARPWRTEPVAHAALTSDTAQLVEAIAVLDHRLAAEGALDGHVIPDINPDDGATGAAAVAAASVANARLVAGTVERFASWSAAHDVVDRARTAPPRPPESAYPVNLVQDPADLAAAQLRLQGFLSPMATRNLDMPYRLAADTANIVARNQTVLLNSLRDRIAESPDLIDELARVESLVDLFSDAIHTIRGLHDNTGPREQPRLRAQQQEISVAVRHGHIGLLSDRQVTHLLAATEAALATWAAAVRREGLRHRTTSFRVGRRGTIDNPVYGRIRENGPAVIALSALAEVTPPVPEHVEVIPTRGRDSLRSTLAQAPQYETTADWPGPGRRHEHRAASTRRPASPGHRR
jgi:hypothetical protein